MSALAKAALSDRRGKALSAVDAVLAGKSESPQAATVELTKAVVRLRDALIESLRAGDATAKRELDHTNSLLSLVVSIQYPMQGKQWEKLKDAREGLARLLAEIGDDALAR